MPNAALWAGKTTPQKEAALRAGTEYLDLQYAGRWFGYKVNGTMSRQWPRFNVVTSDGFAVSSAAVPLGVKNACIEMALRSLTDSFFIDLTESGDIKSESVTIGPLTESTTYAGAKSTVKRYPVIDRMLFDLAMSGNVIYPG
jgi:hypothetical protein